MTSAYKSLTAHMICSYRTMWHLTLYAHGNTALIPNLKQVSF